MMEPSFEKLLVLLAEAGVDFVVVGAIAEKDKFDAMALRQLQEDPKAFD